MRRVVSNKSPLLGRAHGGENASPHIHSGGSITLTNGIASQRPLKGWAVAASICGAIQALTRALAVELAPIRVNAVCPGRGEDRAVARHERVRSRGDVRGRRARKFRSDASARPRISPRLIFI